MTIKEIAEMAGVSRATVSRYLNQGYVSEEKKLKIKAVVDKTGYVPSTPARMLRTKKTRLIGVIIPKIDSETISRILSGISQELNAHNYHMLLANTENNPEKELEYLNIFSNGRVDGVVLIATVLTKRHYQALKRLPVPAVIVGQECEGYSCIHHDDFHAARDLTKELLERGCKRPVFFGVGDYDEAVGKKRRLGFEEALKDSGLWSDDVREVVCEFHSDSGYAQMKKLLNARERFDGVVCVTDNIAAGALRALREAKIQVPDQVRLTGFGDTRLASLMTPPMTTVRYHYLESGIEAGRMVLEEIHNQNALTKALSLGYEIIFRNSW